MTSAAFDESCLFSLPNVCVCVVCLSRRSGAGHGVVIGTASCAAVEWISDTVLTCTPSGDFVVGSYSVRVTLPAGDPSAAPANGSFTGVVIDMLCPAGMFGSLGQPCEPCPAGATCPGGASDPIALPAYYPLSRTQFVVCSPPEACLGAVNASAVGGTGTGGRSVVGCGVNYFGSRCADCRPGSYRLNGGCASCPNTAWLLLLSFFLAVVGCVALAVYLSSKKINFAGLSIGVVRYFAFFPVQVACSPLALLFLAATLVNGIITGTYGCPGVRLSRTSSSCCPCLRGSSLRGRRPWSRCTTASPSSTSTSTCSHRSAACRSTTRQSGTSSSRCPSCC